jgi:uncharacterized membrane protein
MKGLIMNLETIVFAAITFLHDLFTVTWIGGLIVFTITVMPSAKKVLGSGSKTKQFMDVIQKRHNTFVYISIAGLWLTGLLMSRRTHDFGGLFSFTTAYSAALSIKHILVLAMIAISLFRSLALKPTSLKKEKLKSLLMITNLVLGIGVLLVTGFVVALA